MFLSNVQKLKEQLEDECGIDWADAMRMTHIVAELCDSDVFTEEEMMEWEDKPKEEQTYAAIVTHFKSAYDKHARFGSTKSPTTQGYDRANSVTEQAKEDLLQLMLQLLSNQKEVAEAATTDKKRL